MNIDSANSKIGYFQKGYECFQTPCLKMSIIFAVASIGLTIIGIGVAGYCGCIPIKAVVSYALMGSGGTIIALEFIALILKNFPKKSQVLKEDQVLEDKKVINPFKDGRHVTYLNISTLSKKTWDEIARCEQYNLLGDSEICIEQFFEIALKKNDNEFLILWLATDLDSMEPIYFKIVEKEGRAFYQLGSDQFETFKELAVKAMPNLKGIFYLITQEKIPRIIVLDLDQQKG